MNPIEWLCSKAPGFCDLSDDERAAIMHFSLLWSFFEAEALCTNASANAIVTLVHKWASDGRLDIASFAPNFTYFCNRYFQQGTTTEYFNGLKLRDNDKPELVKAVLKGENTAPEDCVAVLFIIVFRLRNNLFHGVKWAYSISGQLDNFKHANAVLMSALEMNSRH